MLERADKLLLLQKLVASRTQAQKLIASSLVQANYQGKWLVVEKPSQPFLLDTEFRVESLGEFRYASRAGLKLEAALNRLIDNGKLQGEKERALNDMAVLDVGQSTGGFTDCLLKYGAKLVVGVEVGHDQLVSHLKTDPRVVSLEGINARYMESNLFKRYLSDNFDAIVMDVSFISQTKILPNLGNLIKSGGLLVSLVKPQFEVGKKAIGKGGIVKPEFQGVEALKHVVTCACENGFIVDVIFQSPITGGDGNTEYLMICTKI